MAHFAESVYMLILNTAATSRWEKSMRLYNDIRQSWDATHDDKLPSFAKEGLNKCWSGSQTMMDVTGQAMAEHKAWIAAGNQDRCKVCQRPRPEERHSHRDWRGFKDNMRCQASRTYYRGNGCDKVGPVSIQDHDVWLALDPSHEDKCYGFDGKCTARRPRPYISGPTNRWIDFGFDSRCFPCYDVEHSQPGRKRRITGQCMIAW